jgi:hypothetical protein
MARNTRSRSFGSIRYSIFTRTGSRYPDLVERRRLTRLALTPGFETSTLKPSNHPKSGVYGGFRVFSARTGSITKVCKGSILTAYRPP